MDRVTLVKREVQTQEWSARIQACRESGMSISAWCRENGIVPKTYYYHLRKLRKVRKVRKTYFFVLTLFVLTGWGEGCFDKLSR